MPRLRFVFASMLLLFTGGCSGWIRLPEGAPADPLQFRQFQVWARGEVRVLHGVRVANDTLTGVPIDQPHDCAHCRIAVPLSTVDSVKAGGGPSSHPFAAGLSVGVLLALAMFFAIAGPWNIFGW